MAQGRLTDKSSRLLDECRTLFSQGDYAAAGTILDRWYEASGPGSVNRTEETDYMRTVIAAETNPAQSMDRIWEFMNHRAISRDPPRGPAVSYDSVP